jgi:hypothetical protein
VPLAKRTRPSVTPPRKPLCRAPRVSVAESDMCATIPTVSANTLVSPLPRLGAQVNDGTSGEFFSCRSESWGLLYRFPTNIP